MSTPPAGTYRIDPVHTFAGFSTKHLLVGRVDGRFNSIEGTFDVTDDVERLFARIDVKIEAATIDTNVEARDDEVVVTTADGAATIGAVAVALSTVATVQHLTLRTPTLDDVFLELTGAHFDAETARETTHQEAHA